MQWHGGKGSKQRTSNYASYTKNYDKIFEKKMGRDELTTNVKVDDDNNVFALLEGDVIEWIKVDTKTVQITVVSEALETFLVPADVFEKTYKPAFK